MTKVSAILTTHNRLELLKKAIESVLQQTYENIEILIMDDASSDGTFEYIKNIESDKVHCLKVDKDEPRGPSYARNLGIQKSTGEYIAFLDDDDEWLPTKIEKQVEILNKNKEVGIVYTGIIYNNTVYNSSITQLPYPKDQGDCSKRIFFNFIGITSNLMVRKEILEKIGGFCENVKFVEDYELMIRVCQITKVDFVNECLIIYRINQNDKNRFTNQTEGWSSNFEYLNKKYEKQIRDLNTEEQQKRILMVYNNHVIRYAAEKNNKKKKEYLYKRYQITHSFKDLIKYIFSLDENKKFKIKSIIDKFFKYI